MKYQLGSQWFFYPACFLAVATAMAGCEKEPLKRHYTEVFIDAQKQERANNDADPHASLQQMMPQDEIHANLNMRDMGLQQGLDASVVKTPLSWETPKEWAEKTGSGMRLATFVSLDEKHPVETTIISLGGEAGGDAANVTRWMRQIQIEVPPAEELEDFISRQERLTSVSNLPVLMVDLTSFQNQPDSPSMIAAIIEREGATIFVKMNGSRQAVLENRGRFKALVQSIKVNE